MQRPRLGPASVLKAPVEAEPIVMTAPGVRSKAHSENRFPIVGIGASAGGLAAFEAFFSAMPADNDTGMAFVLVQHLAPDHKSILRDLIERYTRMPVYEVEDGMQVKRNCTYIIPPNRDMAFVNGVLMLLEPSAPRGLRLPIDFFFRSLAQDQRERAICVVLSGTGSDGTLGARAVKGEGGMVMAQNPDSSEHDGMPRSAIATGLVDYVLPPAEMPAQLITYVTHAFEKSRRSVSAPTADTKETLKKIFILLRSQTGHDFSQYKNNTVMRRVERRMALQQIERVADYLHFAQQNPAEVDALFRDLLIGVTNFFRDPEAFAVLKTEVIPRLFADKPAGAAVRVWVCGCATGEEAYSIAILIHEHLNTVLQDFKLQIFATDVDKRAIEHARSGVFPVSIAADVSADRLAHFFTLDADGAYRIQKFIRDMIVFSEQDVIRDPPFSKLDLISCRNLLIYLNTELQKKLISLFHYALKPEGILFLGTSEAMGEFTTYFEALDHKSKLYLRKRDVVAVLRAPLGDFVPPSSAARTQPRPHRGASHVDHKVDLRKLTEQSLLNHYVQVGVLINRRGDILHIVGRSGKYLEPAPGDAAVNILAMARDGLRRELTIALHKAAANGETVHYTGLRVRTNGDFISTDLTVRPVTRAGLGGHAQAEMFLVILEEASATGPAAAGEAKGEDPNENARIITLEQELRSKEEYLQATLEEMATSNEELQSTNEEMQSVNEELQSTNEELETSREELQSINEELVTVNTELQHKVAGLSRANNDMNNLLAGTGVGTLFVDLELRIWRFTPAATAVINLIPTDIGRPVAHIVPNLVGYNRLEQDVRAVLDTLAPLETELQTKAGAWYLMRVRPYRTLENVIEGAVITFVDITERKKMEMALRDSEARLAADRVSLLRMAIVVRDSNDAITIQGLDGRILAWNRGAERLYGWSEAEALSINIAETVPQERRDEYLSFIHRIESGEVIESFVTQRVTKGGGVVDVWLTVSRLVNEVGTITSIATTERDLSVKWSARQGEKARG
jgi:two-component system, chemotaxis family, CheB/CheR fusion protein